MAIRGARVAAGCVLAASLAVVMAAVASLFFPTAVGSPTPPPTAAAVEAVLQAQTPCERLAVSRDRRAAFVRGTGQRILVIGDSWATGARLEPGVPAWTTLLPGRVSVDGVPGSGFSAGALGCAGLSYADRVDSAVRRAQPALVVVQGGLNDTDQPVREIRRGFLRLSLELGDREVVVLGPTLAPARAAAVPAVDELLAQLCEAAGFTYVRTTDLQLAYHRDGVHLTRKGHRLFGEAVAARIAELR